MPERERERVDEPDPTLLSTQAIERTASAERDYTDGQIAILRQRMDGQHAVTVERFRGIDQATELLSATVTRVPTDLQQAVTALLRLMDERGDGVQARFDANEKLSKTESELNQTALAAALQAAKEASAVQGVATDRTIDKNAELAAVTAAALAARVTQLTEQFISLNSQVTSILAGKQAVVEQKTDTRGGANNIYGAIGTVLGVLSIILVVVMFVNGIR